MDAGDGSGAGVFGCGPAPATVGAEPAADRPGALSRELRGLSRNRPAAVEETRPQLLPAVQARQDAAEQDEAKPRLHQGTGEIRRRTDACFPADPERQRDRSSDGLYCLEVGRVGATVARRSPAASS